MAEMKTVTEWRQKFPIIAALYVLAGAVALASAVLIAAVPDRSDIEHVTFWCSPYEIPIDLAWLACCLVLLGATATLCGGLTGPRMFAVVAVATILFVVIYTYLLAPSWVVTAPDSPAYAWPLINGAYHPSRSSGYPTFLRFVHATFGLNQLGIVQLIIELCSLTAAVGLLGRVYRFWSVAIFLLVALSFYGALLLFSAHLLTEALFLAGFTLAAAGLASAARRPSTAVLIVAGLGLATATLAKAVGIVLVVPALMLVRFMPRQRWSSLVTVVVLPIGVYLWMATGAFIRGNLLTPQATGGIDLAGNVAGFLDGELSDPPGFVAALQEAVRPVLDRRPPALVKIGSWQDLDTYVDYTAREHDTLLGGAILPAAWAQLPGADIQTLDRMLLRVGVLSIMAHPLAYAQHVAAHYYGLWRDLGRYRPSDAPAAAVYIRSTLATTKPDVDWSPEVSDKYFGSLLASMPSSDAALAASAQQQAVPLAFRGAMGLPIFPDEKVTIGIGLLALFLPVLWLLPGRFAHAYRSEIMFALVLDAYVFAHALFQVSMPHYAAVMMPAAVLFVVCFGTTTLRIIWNNLSQKRFIATPGAARSWRL
jgi:hypothetical protein